MAKIIDPSKLLPSAKTSIIKVGKTPSVKLSKKNLSLSKLLIGDKTSKQSVEVNNKLIKVEKFLKSDLVLDQKKAEQKRKEKEQQDFSEAEKKLETPKLKGFKFPSLATPSLGFLDRIKRFIFFTALGWALPKILEVLPKLEGFAKIIGGVYNFAEGLFGKLFDGFMSLVKFGGDLKDKTLGFIAVAKAGVGGNYQTEFDKLEKKFNDFVNISILAGVLSADIGLSAFDEYEKWRKKNLPKPSKPDEGRKPPTGRPRVTEGRGGQKPKGKPKITGDVKSSWWKKLTGGIKGKFSGVVGKLAKPFSKFAGAALPGLGAAIGFADAKARSKSGDKLGAFLAGLSASLDAFTAAVALAGLGAAATGVGLPGAAVLGIAAAAAGTISLSIDVVLLIRDILKAFGVPVFSRGGKIVRRYQGGGSTRGGRPVGGAPKRTITSVRKRKPSKVVLPKVQPGKDVGGEKKIKEFYGEPETTDKNLLSGGGSSRLLGQQPSPFKTLKKMSGTLKSDETLAKGILGLIGSGIDMALGQKPDKKTFKSFFDILGYVSDTLASQRANMSMNSLMSQLRGFADGGTVPSRELRGINSGTSSADLIAKILEPTIGQKVNEAINSIEKELKIKSGTGDVIPSSPPPPGGGGGAPPGPLPTGKNGRYNRGELTYVGMMNPSEPKVTFQNDWYGRKIYLRPDAAAAFRDAQKAAGPKIGWVLNSGYRSLEHQQAVLDAGYPGAPVGYSPHGDGTALDIQTGTNGHAWLVKNGAKYGWRWPNILGDEVHFYYDGSYTAKGQKTTPSNIFQQQPPQQPGGVSPLFQRQTGQPTSKASGKASYYGPGFHGKQTASGAIFNQNALTAASPTLPFGTKVRVRNKANGKVVEVTITDRGPFEPDLVTPHRTRIIDLSKGAMDKLGGLAAGEIDVDLSYRSGGLIAPSKLNRPIPNSFASYENYGQGMMIAIQPIQMIVEKPVPVASGGNSMIAFPVFIGVNNSNDLDRA